jgi:hypothetical protein
VERGQSWSIVHQYIPGNPSTFLGVACAKQAPACLAAGYYRDHNGNDQALLLTGGRQDLMVPVCVRLSRRGPSQSSIQ